MTHCDVCGRALEVGGCPQVGDGTDESIIACFSAGLSRLRASLTTAEKAKANFEHNMMLALEQRNESNAALEKALGALRAVLDTTCDDHADMCCVEWCGRCQDEAVARKAGYAILSGGAHVDALKAQKEEEK